MKIGKYNRELEELYKQHLDNEVSDEVFLARYKKIARNKYTFIKKQIRLGKEW